MLKGIGECESVVELAAIVDVFADAIHKVANIAAVLVPADAMLLRFFLTVNWNLHAVVEQAVRLGVVDDVELHGLARSRIHDSEVKPLGVARGVDVVLHQAVVLRVWDFLSQVQVTRFEARFYQKGFVIVIFKSVYIYVPLLLRVLADVAQGFGGRTDWFITCTLLHQLSPLNELAKVQIVFVHEGVALIHAESLYVDVGRIASKNDVFY